MIISLQEIYTACCTHVLVIICLAIRLTTQGDISLVAAND